VALQAQLEQLRNSASHRWRQSGVRRRRRDRRGPAPSRERRPRDGYDGGRPRTTCALRNGCCARRHPSSR
jgi:hypothetical protein